ncbi:hypothetical protein KC332_g9869 [Hortaea werneckii]|uniref:Uncharacterized protein n=1 Tax=Hortaea werneckii EXF-2000 TaxID=1157616 RepID=A0A1Z5T5J8_HORWE|nr:hypothetical protein KC358_g14326 [Hortaea werneckii]OTA31326.1 hypothetical protein BTJ68_08369 [Hortaea werneckii EXF-2000]KAI6807365.1 hypothetical protein KC350_g13807 [Hortaea werneckii]KAI6899995.1 hypothetical protein KC348_g16977 [Hortaea werneckii]KAI6921348.1 hypothetical protein KC341_g15984 [Hortaea werneckii]
MHLMKILCGIAMEGPAGKPTIGNTRAIQPDQDGRLLYLSPELRNIIYEEVLVDPENIEIPKDEEAGTIFYGLNTFTSTHNRLEDLPLWLARLPLKLRRSVKVIELRYEIDAEVRIMTRDFAAEAPLEYDIIKCKTYENAESRGVSARENFQSAVVHMLLLGLDLNAFRLPPLPPPFHEVSTEDIGKWPETLGCIFEASWINSANMHVRLARSIMAGKCFPQCRGYERWLRKVATDTKDENTMASLPEIINNIQG